GRCLLRRRRSPYGSHRTCGRRGGGGWRPSQPELQFGQLVAFEITFLPRVVVHWPVPDVRILPMGFDKGIPAVGLVNRDDVCRERRGNRGVPLDNHQVIVVLARCLVPEVVRTGHDHRVGAEHPATTSENGRETRARTPSKVRHPWWYNSN